MSDSVRSVGSSVSSDKSVVISSSDKGIDKIRKEIESSVKDDVSIKSKAEESSKVSKQTKVAKSTSTQQTKAQEVASAPISTGKDTADGKSGKVPVRVRKNSSHSDHGSDSEKLRAKSVAEKEGKSPLPSRKSKDELPRESLLKMVNSPRSRKERLKLAEMLRSYASSQNKLSFPRFNLQLSGMYDKLETQMEDLRLEELSPHVQLQIAQLIEDDVKPDLTELEKALFTASCKTGTATIEKEYRRTDSNEISSTTSSTSSRSKSSHLDQQLSGGHGDLPVVIKSEPADSGYEKSGSVVQSGSGKGSDPDGSAVVSSSGVSDMETGGLLDGSARQQSLSGTEGKVLFTIHSYPTSGIKNNDIVMQ